jgi:hypothetical protein
VRRKRAGKAVLLDPDLFKARLFRFGVSGQVLQQIGLGGLVISFRMMRLPDPEQSGSGEQMVLG